MIAGHDTGDEDIEESFDKQENQIEYDLESAEEKKRWRC